MSRCFKCMRELKPNDSQCPDCRVDNRTLAARQLACALPCGTLLHGRYMIGQVLGQGGFGITYIAYDNAFRQKVCIKEFFPGGAMRDVRRSSAVYWSTGGTQNFQIDRDIFYREARSLVGLRDVSSVVTVWDVFKENDWIDDIRTGKGTFTYEETGSVYEGDWVNNKRIGKGSYTWGENTEWAGDVYEGDWVDNKLNGQGTLTYADGTVKTGQWENDSYMG